MDQIIIPKSSEKLKAEPIKSKINKKKIAIIIGIVVLILGGISALIYFKYPHLLPWMSQTVSINENDESINQLKSKKSLAEQKISEKYKDYEISLKSLAVLKKESDKELFNQEYANLDIDITNTYLFDFVATKDKVNKEIIYFVKMDADEIVKTIESSGAANKQKISLDDIKISSAKAWETFNKSGGDTFKSENTDYTQYGPEIIKNDEYGTCWKLGYVVDKNNTRTFLILYISAADGTVKAQEK